MQSYRDTGNGRTTIRCFEVAVQPPRLIEDLLAATRSMGGDATASAGELAADGSKVDSF